MKNKASRRTFLQSGLVLPAAGLVLPASGFSITPLFEAALQEGPPPGAKTPPKMDPPSGYPDTGKYGKYVIKEPYAKYHQLENVTVTPQQLMTDCIITHQVFYKKDTIVGAPMASRTSGRAAGQRARSAGAAGTCAPRARRQPGCTCVAGRRLNIG